MISSTSMSSKIFKILVDFKWNSLEILYLLDCFGRQENDNRIDDLKGVEIEPDEDVNVE